MKKTLVCILAMVLFMSSTAFAETNDIKRFEPYTGVDLDVFVEAGYSCSYDNFEFSAELSPTKSIWGSTLRDSYQIMMDIKIIYNAGSCTLVPRLIFIRNGEKTYYDDRMGTVYIANGENRYIIDTTGCSRSTNSGSKTAKDISVEPIRSGGLIMLRDLAENPQTITVKMGSYSDAFTLTDANQQALKVFYDDCTRAGIFDQEYFSGSDDYSIRTFFN